MSEIAWIIAKTLIVPIIKLGEVADRLLDEVVKQQNNRYEKD